ncbi:MAG: flagellar M-ring protein FliF [Nitrospirae bacterium]|nr:flagellar M-ring protein FliF [Nitrospirota bacterium]
MEKVLATIKKWPKKKQIAVLWVFVMSLAGLVLLFSWTSKTEYRLLFTNLSESDAGAIVEKLKAAKVPYVVGSDGISVPAEKVYGLRIQLASEGLPLGGAIGFELFDKSNFSTTDFVQKVNYRRALQGELVRTIRSLNEIEDARVHLSIPEKSLFATKSENPSASVVVKLKPQTTLSKRQLDGIVHLVASSIERLDPKNVDIIDSSGNMLTKKEDDDSGLSGDQMAYLHKFEKDTEDSIVDLLTSRVGKGKVKAMVTASIDFTRKDTSEETYDPDSKVERSEQSLNENTTSTGTGGVPGVMSNLPGIQPPPVTSSQAQSQKQNSTKNFEISKTLRHETGSFRSIKRVTAAVLVDGLYEESADKKAARKYIPRTAEELSQLTELVKRTIGFDKDRGDEVTVVSMQFEPEKEEFTAEKVDYVTVAMAGLKSIIPLLAIIAFFILVLRPVIKILTPQPAVTDATLRAAALEMAAEARGAEKPEPEEVVVAVAEPEVSRELDPKQAMIDWAKSDPAAAANLIKNWMMGARKSGS